MSSKAELQKELLGSGIVRPLQRISGNDFVSAMGETLVRGSIEQIMGTKPGELRWRPSFGIDLERYRHRGATGALSQAVADEIVEAISKWEPRVSTSAVVARAEDNVIRASINWAIITAAVEGNNVLLGPVNQEVEV